MGSGPSKPFNQLLVSDVVAKQNLLKIDANQSLRGALDVLASLRILSAPVRGPNGDLGFLDVLDIVAYISTNYLGKSNSFSDEENLENPCKNAIDCSGRNPVFYITPKSLLKDALKQMAKEKVRRLAVCDEADTRHVNILNIITQSDVFAQIASHKTELFTPLHLKKKIGELKIGFKDVETCRVDDITRDAFWKMISRGFSALGVVDEAGRLVSALSASEVRGLTEHNLSSLELPVDEFLEMRKVKSFKTCTADDKFEEVINVVNEERLHRIFIVDKDYYPVGLLSLTDFIFQVFANDS